MFSQYFPQCKMKEVCGAVVVGRHDSPLRIDRGCKDRGRVGGEVLCQV